MTFRCWKLCVEFQTEQTSTA